jgi:hypothetical protein
MNHELLTPIGTHGWFAMLVIGHSSRMECWSIG